MAPAVPPAAVAAVRTVRLQLALASAFTAVAVCLAGVMGGLTYLSNRDLVIDTAHEAMRQSSRQIVSGVGQHIAQLTRVVSALARADAGAARGSRNMLVFRCFGAHMKSTDCTPLFRSSTLSKQHQLERLKS
jgi:hypothetical protein